MSVNKGAGVGRLADREHVELEWLYRVREIVLLKYSYILEHTHGQRAGEAQRGRLHSKKTFVFLTELIIIIFLLLSSMVWKLIRSYIYLPFLSGSRWLQLSLQYNILGRDIRNVVCVTSKSNMRPRGQNQCAKWANSVHWMTLQSVKTAVNSLIIQIFHKMHWHSFCGDVRANES